MDGVLGHRCVTPRFGPSFGRFGFPLNVVLQGKPTLLRWLLKGNPKKDVIWGGGQKDKPNSWLGLVWRLGDKAPFGFKEDPPQEKQHLLPEWTGNK